MSWILAQTAPRGFWMPPQASTVSDEVDSLFYFVFWITVFFLVLILTLMIWFVIRYRHREGREDAERAPAHSTALELTWTVIPTVLVLMIFYYGFRGFLKMSIAPPDAYEIQVTASSWNWSFTYPDGTVANELNIPKGVPIRLVLSTPERDVIHSFYVPQFRVKRDAVPGRYNRVWFEATQLSPPEGFDIYCAEYCGQQHSKMRTKLIVHEPDGFKAWLEDAANWEKRMSPVEAGQMFVKNMGCLQCHSVDGSKNTAPTFKDLFGSQRPMADKSSVPADENYIRESIYDPGAKIAEGFSLQMSSYRGRLKDKDVNAIIAYLKSISSHYQSSLPASGPATVPTR
jgi:cytochrome c oxidase subunit II